MLDSILNNTCLWQWFLFAFAFNLLIASFWHFKFYRQFYFLKQYRGVQRIHFDEVPRMGGLVILVSLVGFLICDNGEIELSKTKDLLSILLLSLIPTALISFFEDITHNIEPTTRFIAILLSFLFFRLLYTDHFPLTGMDVIDTFLNRPGGITIFFGLATIAITNGANLIDGVNGLCGLMISSILIALIFLSHSVGDQTIFQISFILIIFVFNFLLFNYPLGKIFLGDLGAYCLGLLVSFLVIIFFGRHPELSPWGAVLLLIYPATEILFTFLRRLVRGQSVYKPDRDHLHMKLFYFFYRNINFKKIASFIVAPSLAILWLTPLILPVTFFMNDRALIGMSFFFIFTYLVFYNAIPSIKKKKKKNS